MSFKETSLHFPMVWARHDRSVNAVNVTVRYKKEGEELPNNLVRMSFVVRNKKTNKRVPAKLTIRNQQGAQVFSERTKGPRADMNNHLNVPLKQGKTYQLIRENQGIQRTRTITVTPDAGVIELSIEE